MKYSKNTKSKLTRTNKSKRKSKRKYNKSIIKGGSKIYNDGTITETPETHKGERFFRKIFYYSTPPTKDELYLVYVETEIVKKLMENPHPNIVKFFKINNRSVDMEELNTKDVDIDKAIEVMTIVKDFLQTLGIAYIDWKIDNIGIAQDGTYKLFDFDSSGIFNKTTNTWLVKPAEFFNYKAAVKQGITTPKEIDNYSFNIFSEKGVGFSPFVPLELRSPRRLDQHGRERGAAALGRRRRRRRKSRKRH